MHCPLCHKLNRTIFYAEKTRYFYRCKDCNLIYLDKKFWPSSEKEKKIYDLHENSVTDLGYRKFLSRLIDPLIENIPKYSEGLDFGCGNGPALAVMLEELGYRVSLFDLYYHNNPNVFLEKYNFIVSTEVFEHLSRPKEVLLKLMDVLKTQGVLGVMTKLAKDQKAFSKWHYKNDQTHICFYSEETFEWIARKFNFKLQFFNSDVILLQKS